MPSRLFKTKHTKKVGSGNTKHKIRDLQQAELRHMVYTMRLDYDAQHVIAKKLGISQGRVSQLINEEVKLRAEQWTATQDEHTRFEVERIEKLISESQWFKKSKTQPRIAEVFLKWSERRDRLLGLYTNKHEVSGPNGTSLRASFNWDALDSTELEIYEMLTAKLQGLPTDTKMRVCVVHDADMPKGLERNTKAKAVTFNDDILIGNNKL